MAMTQVSIKDQNYRKNIQFNDSELVVDSQHYMAALAVFASTFLQAAIYIFLRWDIKIYICPRSQIICISQAVPLYFLHDSNR